MEKNRLLGLLEIISITIFVWGCLTFGIVGNGFSYALWAFLLLLVTSWKRIIKISIPGKMADWGWPIAFFYGVLCVVGVFQGNIERNLFGSDFGAVTLFLITLPMWIILCLGWNRNIGKAICIAIYVYMYGFTGYGLWQYLVQNQDRFMGFYNYPPETGMMLDLLLPFTVAIGLYYRKYGMVKVVMIPLIVLESVALILTETRGSYLSLSAALLITGIIWALYYKGKVSIRIKLIFGTFIIAFICAAAVYTWMIGSESHSRMVGGERLLMWESSYHMWEDHKVLGVGLDEWKDQYNEKNGLYSPVGKKEINMMPHNIYLQFLATGGMLAFLGLLGFIVLMLRYLLKNIINNTDNPFAWGMLFIFIAFMAHGLVDGTIISKHIGRIFYLLMGVGILFTERWQYNCRY